MEYSKAISYINILPDTQESIKLFVDKVLAEVEIREALPLLVKLTAMGKIVEGIKAGIKEQLIEEASLYAGEGKSFEVNGVRFTKSERKTYHFNHCETWRRLNEEIEAVEGHLKIGDWIDPATGEVVPKATVSFSESISVTLKKS